MRRVRIAFAAPPVGLAQGVWENGLNGLGETMSGEIIAILAVGVALAGVILTSLKGTETRLREDMKQLSERVARVEHSQAKLEGLLEGLREAISGRTHAS